MDLAGKVVAVTGGFGILGAQVVAAAARAGAQVAAIDIGRPSASGHDVCVRQYGEVDASDAASARQAFECVAREFGGLDALVNVAGGFRWETLGEGSLDTWDLLYKLNLRTAVAACQAALPHLVQRSPGSRIVNVGALGATKGTAGMAAYAASKAGVARLTESLAEELKDRGVTVNAVLPSIIDTPTNRIDMPEADFDRWVKPEQIAEVIVFLLSPRSQAITGALLPVPGRV